LAPKTGATCRFQALQAPKIAAGAAGRACFWRLNAAGCA